MKKKRKIFMWTGALAILLSIYPLFVLIYTWSCVFRSDFVGGRHGQLDAYRHALASAIVAYTLDERAVDLTTRLMEYRGKDSNRMDRHNNQTGALIGAHSRSFQELEPSVRQAVLDGAVNSTNTNQITWLPKEKWRDGRFW